MKVSSALKTISLVLLGIVIGGYLFRGTQPRSFLSVENCSQTCWSSNDIAGLATSVLVQRTGWVPKVVMETDKTILIEHPFPTANYHYVAIPKRDIKNASLLTDDDRLYLDDAYAVMAEMVREKGFKHWRIVTNGPGYQEATYLHFHLQAKD